MHSTFSLLQLKFHVLCIMRSVPTGSETTMSLESPTLICPALTV